MYAIPKINWIWISHTIGPLTRTCKDLACSVTVGNRCKISTLWMLSYDHRYAAWN